MSNLNTKLNKVPKKILILFQERVNKIKHKLPLKFKISKIRRQKNNYSTLNNVLLIIISIRVQSRNINYDFNFFNNLSCILFYM